MMSDISLKLKKINDQYRTICPDWTEREHLLGRMAKLNEEVGELCEAALFEVDSVQQHKSGVNFDAELADVMIVTLLLAQDREKDIWKEVGLKINKQLEKYNIE